MNESATVVANPESGVFDHHKVVCEQCGGHEELMVCEGTRLCRGCHDDPNHPCAGDFDAVTEW